MAPVRTNRDVDRNAVPRSDGVLARRPVFELRSLRAIQRHHVDYLVGQRDVGCGGDFFDSRARSSLLGVDPVIRRSAAQRARVDRKIIQPRREGPYCIASRTLTLARSGLVCMPRLGEAIFAHRMSRAKRSSSDMVKPITRHMPQFSELAQWLRPRMPNLNVVERRLAQSVCVADLRLAA